MAGQLDDRVILLTGASHGIGEALAWGLAREGADLVIVSRHQREVEALATELSQLGSEVLPLAADVSQRDQVEAMVEAALGHFGRIDVLINNAGIQGPPGRAWEVDPDQWVRTIQVNLVGAFLCCRAVLPSMVARRQGTIINVSSGAGRNPMPNYSGYSASKAGVTHFTRTLAEETKALGINANAIGVWGVTRLWHQVATDGAPGGPRSQGVAEMLRSGIRPQPQENVALVVFLASPAARHITGQYIEANSLPDCLIAQREG
ncbi:MAG: SDR family oxidoreductase [Anaerolineae bacterium]|nr:SDR family oxidoreductase [Anaerolineae bacterium]